VSIDFKRFIALPSELTSNKEEGIRLNNELLDFIVALKDDGGQTWSNMVRTFDEVFGIGVYSEYQLVRLYRKRKNDIRRELARLREREANEAWRQSKPLTYQEALQAQSPVPKFRRYSELTDDEKARLESS
jgi:hypothetical protein